MFSCQYEILKIRIAPPNLLSDRLSSLTFLTPPFKPDGGFDSRRLHHYLLMISMA